MRQLQQTRTTMSTRPSHRRRRGVGGGVGRGGRRGRGQRDQGRRAASLRPFSAKGPSLPSRRSLWFAGPITTSVTATPASAATTTTITTTVRSPSPASVATSPSGTSITTQSVAYEREARDTRWSATSLSLPSWEGVDVDTPRTSPSAPPPSPLQSHSSPTPTTPSAATALATTAILPVYTSALATGAPQRHHRAGGSSNNSSSSISSEEEVPYSNTAGDCPWDDTSAAPPPAAHAAAADAAATKRHQLAKARRPKYGVTRLSLGSLRVLHNQPNQQQQQQQQESSPAHEGPSKHRNKALLSHAHKVVEQHLQHWHKQQQADAAARKDRPDAVVRADYDNERRPRSRLLQRRLEVEVWKMQRIVESIAATRASGGRMGGTTRHNSKGGGAAATMHQVGQKVSLLHEPGLWWDQGEPAV